MAGRSSSGEISPSRFSNASNEESASPVKGQSFSWKQNESERAAAPPSSAAPARSTQRSWRAPLILVVMLVMISYLYYGIRFIKYLRRLPSGPLT